MEANISNFSYQETNLENYLRDGFDCDFNFNIIEELERKAVRLAKFEKKLYFDGKIIEGFKSPISFSPLEFLNLFYHEFDLIKQNTSPLSTVNRLQSINIKPFDRLYLYIKLIEILRKDSSNSLLVFQSNLIEREYQIIFDLYLSKSPDFIKDELDDIILTSNIALILLPNVCEKLKSLIEIKNNKERFHNDNLINNIVYKYWLIPKIEHYTELNKAGIVDDNTSLSEDLMNLLGSNLIEVEKEKTLLNYATRFQYHLVLEQLKNKFSTEKGKSIRLLIEVLKELDIVSIPDRENKKFFLALKTFFGRNIGSYQAVFDYEIVPYDDETLVGYKKIISQLVREYSGKK